MAIRLERLKKGRYRKNFIVVRWLNEKDINDCVSGSGSFDSC